MATLVTYNDLKLTQFTSVIKPLISAVFNTDNGFNIITNSTIKSNTTVYISIFGNNFTPSTQVYSRLIGVINIPKLATSVAYVSKTQLNVQLQPSNAGSALLYVVTSYGTTGITTITFV
jgi:hypothetical protein